MRAAVTVRTSRVSRPFDLTGNTLGRSGRRTRTAAGGPVHGTLASRLVCRICRPTGLDCRDRWTRVACCAQRSAARAAAVRDARGVPYPFPVTLSIGAVGRARRRRSADCPARGPCRAVSPSAPGAHTRHATRYFRATLVTAPAIANSARTRRHARRLDRRARRVVLSFRLHP